MKHEDLSLSFWLAERDIMRKGSPLTKEQEASVDGCFAMGIGLLVILVVAAFGTIILLNQ